MNIITRFRSNLVVNLMAVVIVIIALIAGAGLGRLTTTKSPANASVTSPVTVVTHTAFVTTDCGLVCAGAGSGSGGSVK